MSDPSGEDRSDVGSNLALAKYELQVRKEEYRDLAELWNSLETNKCDELALDCSNYCAAHQPRNDAVQTKKWEDNDRKSRQNSHE